MSQKVQKPYLSNERVLIQLIVEEYVRAYHMIYPLVMAVKKKRRKSQELINHGTALFEEIRQAAFQLGGFATKRLFSIPWSCDRGALERLERYTYLLVTHSERYNPLLLLLHQTVQKSRINARELLTLLQFWDCRNNLFFDDFDPHQAFVLFDELEEMMRRAAETLVQVIQVSSEDENICLIFLKRGPDFIRFFGKRFYKEALQGIFPQGVVKGANRLEKKFLSRGFPEQAEELPALLERIGVSS